MPLVTLSYAFHGGASQDDADKSGAANLPPTCSTKAPAISTARPITSAWKTTPSSSASGSGRDEFHGSLRALNEHRDEASTCWRLALTAPRFEASAIERVRGQELAACSADTTIPIRFPATNGGRPPFPAILTAAKPKARWIRCRASPPTTCAITCAAPRAQRADDLDRRRRRCQDRRRPDRRAFGSLPAHNDLKPVANASPRGSAAASSSISTYRRRWSPSAAPGLPATIPILAGYVVNHNLGGGTFSSRLYREVRESAASPTACPTTWSGSSARRW